MKTGIATERFGSNSQEGSFARCRLNFLLAGAVLALLTGATGCQTATPQAALAGSSSPPAIVLQEGNVIKVSFPGAPNLNTSQPIRRDGVIALPLVGEVKAAGSTPAELEKALVGLYSSKLVSKDVTVSLESATFPVFITGAVLRPGKVVAERPLTVLEAIMEAGGFDYMKANLRAVRVIRNEKNQSKHYTLDLKLILEGQKTELFYLKPSDIVYVPERFSWF